MKKLGVLISGSGRSLENLFEHIERGELAAEVALVLSSNGAAFGLERARRRNVPAEICESKAFPTPQEYSEALFRRLDAAGVDLVVLAGFLKVVRVPERYSGKVINIHPSLLPAFGGRGMYGHHVHEAVLASGARISGCTVHYVTNEVDGGPIIEQRSVEVEDGDTADTLAARVFAEEMKALPHAIALHLGGTLRIEGKRVHRIVAC